MTEPQRRTTAIDAAISDLNSQLSQAVEQRRTMVRDVNASPESLAKLNTQIQALRDKVEGQRELRAEAAKLDARDAFLRERAALKKRAEVLTARLTKDRVAAARKLDRACALMGEALGELDQINREAWREFVSVTRELGLPARVVDSALDNNRSRLAEGASAVTALLHALKEAGLGKAGVIGGAVTQAFNPGVTWWGPTAHRAMTIERATADAGDFTAESLARLFAQAEEAAAETIDG